ncbi:hypothetical protein [Methylobacterium sp. A52T]
MAGAVLAGAVLAGTALTGDLGAALAASARLAARLPAWALAMRAAVFRGVDAVRSDSRAGQPPQRPHVEPDGAHGKMRPAGRRPVMRRPC